MNKLILIEKVYKLIKDFPKLGEIKLFIDEVIKRDKLDHIIILYDEMKKTVLIKTKKVKVVKIKKVKVVKIKKVKVVKCKSFIKNCWCLKCCDELKKHRGMCNCSSCFLRMEHEIKYERKMGEI